MNENQVHRKKRNQKTEKAASEVSSNSAPSPAPVTTPASIPSATGDVDTFVGQPCPLCGKGIIIKGKNRLRMFGMEKWMYFPEKFLIEKG